jgi:hypothetical protein
MIWGQWLWLSARYFWIRNYREAISVNVNNKKVSQLEGFNNIALILHARETNEIIKLLDTNVSCWPYAGNTQVGLEAINMGVTWYV